MKGNVIGISAFKGPKGSESAHHAFSNGMTGSGKSVFGNDFLTQIDLYSDKTVVVDFGNSYGLTMNLLSGGKSKPFEPDPNGQDTLNYWDTGGLPMSMHSRQTIVRVIHLMAGHKSSEDEDYLRRAIISGCVRRFLEFRARQWIDAKLERREQLIQLLAQLRCFARKSRLKEDLSEIYALWSHAPTEDQEVENDELEQEVTQITEDDGDLINLSFAMMSWEEVPTHSQFHDWLEIHSQEEEEKRNRVELEKLVTLLEVWRADRGIMGKLFDGPNTIDLGARHVHIELAGLADSDETIRSLVSFILSNKILGSIARMPRSQRKHVVLEELGAFLNIKGAGQIVRDFYERSRKYNCFVLSVIQQISNLPKDIARSVIGNCRQGFFFAQKDPKDIDLLQELFELPGSTVEILKNFKEPSAEEGAPFLCWERDGNRVRITPASNIANQEMLYVANSSGSLYEERRRALAQYDDPLEGVIVEVAKQAENHPS